MKMQSFGAAFFYAQAHENVLFFVTILAYFVTRLDFASKNDLFS